MIKYTPATLTTPVLYEGVEIHVSSDLDYVTVDSDGEVYGWESTEAPVLTKGAYRHPKSNSQGYIHTYIKKWIGTFEKSDGGSFTPELFEI